jgi:toxin ParE1/3/4
MSLPALFRYEARDDIQTAFEYYEAIRPGLGKKFLGHLYDALERIELLPELHGIVWRSVRAAPLKKFRYVVYYEVIADRVEVIAVMHGARHASAWQKRVEE